MVGLCVGPKSDAAAVQQRNLADFRQRGLLRRGVEREHADEHIREPMVVATISPRIAF
jgi:hypothetical protein